MVNLLLCTVLVQEHYWRVSDKKLLKIIIYQVDDCGRFDLNWILIKSVILCPMNSQYQIRFPSSSRLLFKLHQVR